MGTANEVIERSYEIPDNTLPYSQIALDVDGYRADCSGQVSKWLGLPPPGLSTVGLYDVCRRIDESELAPGDIIGLLGEGTLGDVGHVQLFIAHASDGLFIAEQTGGSAGPHHHTIKRINSSYDCYRYEGLEMDEEAKMWIRNMSDIIYAVTTGKDSVKLHYAWAGDGHNFGDEFTYDLTPYWARVKAQASGIDYDALAKKVANEIYARMKE